MRSLRRRRRPPFLCPHVSWSGGVRSAEFNTKEQESSTEILLEALERLLEGTEMYSTRGCTGLYFAY